MNLFCNKEFEINKVVVVIVVIAAIVIVVVFRANNFAYLRKSYHHRQSHSNRSNSTNCGY